MMNGCFLSPQNVVQFSCVVHVSSQFVEVKCIHKKRTVKKKLLFLFSYTRIKDSFEKLSADLQKKLSDAKEFAKATVEELKKVPQDLLSSLKVCVNS